MDSLNDLLTKFKQDDTQTELVFCNKTSEERKQIHDLCIPLQLKSESKGIKTDRKLIVTKDLIANNTVTITDAERKLLIRDYSLPIPIHFEPYFSYLVNLLDPIANTQTIYNLLVSTKEILNKRQLNLKSESYKLMNDIIAAIKSAPNYADLIKDSKYDTKILPNDLNIYNKTPTYYISLDIIKANFTSAKFISSALVLGCNTWEELIGKFTDLDYFIQSKHFRQLIFGNLGIKKLPVVQKYMLTKLYDQLKDKVTVLGKYGTDELFIATTKETIKDDCTKLKTLISELPEEFKHIWKISPILVEPLGSSQGNTVKTFVNLDNLDNYKLAIRNVHKDFYAQAYKFYVGEEIVDNDLMAIKEEYPIKYCTKVSF